MSNKNDGSDEVARETESSQGESSSVQEKGKRASEKREAGGDPGAEPDVEGAPADREQDEQPTEQDEVAAAASDTDAADSDEEKKSGEAPRAVTSERAMRRRKAKRGGGSRDRKTKKLALSEEEINSPSKQTLAMLGVVAGATLVMWGVGRAKCNYHEVGEGMKPREVTLEERTRTPQDVAFAFQHALSSYDFKVAEKLATGEAKRLVGDRKSQCKGGSCESKRESLKGQVNSVAELLKRTPTHALARVWSEGPDLSAQEHMLVLERDGRNWRVDSYSKDTGKQIELPGAAPAMGHDGSVQERLQGGSHGDRPPMPGSAAPEQKRLPDRGPSDARSPEAPAPPQATPKPPAAKPAPPAARPAPARPALPAAPAPGRPATDTGAP